MHCAINRRGFYDLIIYVGTLGEGQEEPRKLPSLPSSSSFLKYKQEKTLGHPEMVPQIRWDRNF